MILIDTDVAIDILRKFPPAIGWFASLSPSDTVGMSGYSAMELVNGSRDKPDLERIRRFLDSIIIMWPGAAECSYALENFMSVKLSSGVSPIDVFIAHNAMSEEVALHTFNVKHFKVFEGLVLIQPYSRQDTSSQT